MDQQASSSSATSIASQAALELHRQLPPLRHGEYDALVPTTPQGLMLRILKGNGFAAFNGYLSLADGRSSPAELLKCIRGIGDKITAVEGAFVDGMSFEEVIGKIRRACATKKVVHLRLKEPSSRAPPRKGVERDPIGKSVQSASTVQAEASKGAHSNATQASMTKTLPDLLDLKPKQVTVSNTAGKGQPLIKIPVQGVTPTPRGGLQVGSRSGTAVALPSAKLVQPNPAAKSAVVVTGSGSSTLVKTSPSGHLPPKEGILSPAEKSKKTDPVIATASTRQAKSSEPPLLNIVDGLVSAVRMPVETPALIKPHDAKTSIPRKTSTTMGATKPAISQPLSVEARKPLSALTAVSDTQTNRVTIATATAPVIEPALDDPHRKSPSSSNVIQAQDAATEDQPTGALNHRSHRNTEPPIIQAVASAGSGTRHTPGISASAKQVGDALKVYADKGRSTTALAYFPMRAPRKQLVDRIKEGINFFTGDPLPPDDPAKFPASSAPKEVDHRANSGESISLVTLTPSATSLPVSSEAVVAKTSAESTNVDGKAPATLALHEPVVSPETDENDVLFGLSIPQETDKTEQCIPLTPTKPTYTVGAGVDFPDGSRRVSDSSDSGVLRRRKICASKSVLVDDCMSSAPKRQRLNERKTDIIFKLVQAKWVDEYDVKKVKRIPIAYAMRMDDFDPQNDAKRHVNEKATKKVSSGAGAGAGSKHKKKLSAKKVGHSRSTTTSVNKSLSAKKVGRSVSVTPPHSRSLPAKKAGRPWSTTLPREKESSRSDKTNRLKSLDTSVVSKYMKVKTPILIYDGPPNKPLDGGWPDGWVQKTFQRQGSSHADSYYFPPSSEQRLRSLAEVRRFLNR